MLQDGSARSNLLQELACCGGALPRLLQCQEMGRLRQKVVVHNQDVAQVQGRQIGGGHSGVRSDDLDGTAQRFKVHGNSEYTGVVD